MIEYEINVNKMQIHIEHILSSLWTKSLCCAIKCHNLPAISGLIYFNSLVSDQKMEMVVYENGYSLYAL